MERFPLPATAKLFLHMSSIGTYTLRAEFMTLDGHVTATYVDFQSAFAIDPSTNDLDLANTSPSWTEGSIRFKTRITERHVLVVNYHSSPTLTIERRLYLLPLLSVSGTTLYFQNWYCAVLDRLESNGLTTNQTGLHQSDYLPPVIISRRRSSGHGASRRMGL